MDVLFGPWARLSSFQLPSISVVPVAGSEQLLRELQSDSGYSKGWIYPPLRKPPNDDRPDAPLIPVLAYGLPPTHTLTLDSPYDQGELADFLIAIMGFVDGVRLTRDGWTHFYKAPLVLDSLGDTSAYLKEVVEIIRVGADLWMANTPPVRSRLFGAIHWFQFSSLLEHDFERFGGFYSVLDTLYWIHRSWVAGPKIPHGERGAHLATFYGMSIPTWAVQPTTGQCPLAAMRNALVHEARYGGAPIGFAFPQDFPDIALELGHFVSRLLYATLHIPCGYVCSVVTSRQMHGLDLCGPLQAV